MATAAVSQICADVEHVTVTSTHLLRTGGALIAAAKCYTHNAVDRVHYDEAGKLLREGELLQEPASCAETPRGVLAADVGAG
jgi:hypothetical protein